MLKYKISDNITSRVTAIIAVTLLAGCANNRGFSGDPCNAGAVAAISGAITAVSDIVDFDDKDQKDKVEKGAALVMLTCLAVNVYSRRTKSSEESDKDYVRTKGQLPTKPELVFYTSNISGNPVRRGQYFTVNSAVEIVNGVNSPAREVREKLQIFNPDNSEIKSGIKDFSSDSGGRYENQFTFKLPENSSQGEYKFRTIIYINGKEVGRRDFATKVVWDGDILKEFAAL